MSLLPIALSLLAITMFISQLGIGLIIPILPQYLTSLGASGAQMGYLVAVMGISLLLFSPLAGTFCDQYGRKKFIVGGIGVFGLSQLIFGCADSMWMLYAARLLGGIGIACMSPAVTAYVTDITTGSQRGQGHGFIGAAMSLGIVIGPGIGAFLAEYGLRRPFFLAAAAALTAMTACMLVLPETLNLADQPAARRFLQHQPNLFSQFTSSFRAPYWLLLIFIFAMTFGLASIETIFGLYVSQKYGFAPRQIATLITAGASTGVFVQSVLFKSLLTYFHEVRIISGSLLLAAAALFCMLLSGNFVYLLGVNLIFFTALSTLRPAINTLLSKISGNEQGFVAGMNSAYTSLGIILGPAIGGLLFDIYIDLPLICGALVILSSLAVLPLWTKKNRQSSMRDQQPT